MGVRRERRVARGVRWSWIVTAEQSRGEKFERGGMDSEGKGREELGKK